MVYGAPPHPVMHLPTIGSWGARLRFRWLQEIDSRQVECLMDFRQFHEFHQSEASAFEDCKSLSSIVIPNGLRRIEACNAPNEQPF